jgi:hypothetical protein
LGRAQGHPVLGCGAGKIVFGQVGPVDGRGAVAAQHDNLALVFLPPQHFGSSKSRCAATDDNNFRRRVRTDDRRLERLRSPFSHEDFAVPLFDQPDIDWAESWRVQSLACPKAEASVMPRASHGLVDNQSVGEGAVIVSAVRAYREDIPSPTGQQHLFVADMAEEHASIRQFEECDPLR